MMLQRILFTGLALLAASVNAETLAKAHGDSWDFSVEVSGPRASPNCDAALVAKGGQGHYRTTLKNDQYGCMFWGPVQVNAGKAGGGKSALVFLEAGRGGDSDHSGPIITAYSLDAQGFKKLGEQELFNATYQRSGDEIVSVSGKVLFTFAPEADGRGGAGEWDIFVPAVLSTGCQGVCVRPHVTEREKAAIVARFDAQKTTYLRAPASDPDFAKSYAEDLERTFIEFLNRQPG